MKLTASNKPQDSPYHISTSHQHFHIVSLDNSQRISKTHSENLSYPNENKTLAPQDYHGIFAVRVLLSTKTESERNHFKNRLKALLWWIALINLIHCDSCKMRAW
ncbi:unnamed protein product [Ilex paraguariensis]|uniref:Uncharacterized protein n=1 Tax=Ilex paraguariensis TaxID=185542 RepID=A0ABC8SCU0_9AQUA